MKKYLKIVAIIVIIAMFGNYIYFQQNYIYIPKSETKKISYIDNNKFVIKDEFGKENKIKIRGVNLGLGIPGHFATERAISKETYLRWFKQISELGANTIRVYTIQGEEFYDAIYEYNSKNKEHPLYIIHGVWLEEKIHMANIDASNKNFKHNLENNAKNVIDAIHGKLKIRKLEESGSQSYRKNISKWVIGYIFGVEWEEEAVIYTNKMNQDKKQYKGKYIYTENASPFEIFLAQIVDEIIEYESKKYGEQRNFALTNWPLTDPIKYNERIKILHSKYASVDVEKIKTTDKFKSNQFASYHIYPYYPEYEYNGDNNVNLYREYLTKINNHHSMPVVISEFGVPSSRGIASYEKNRKLGRDQGNLSEQEQGNAIVSMYKDIIDSGSAGAIVFIWQDEWFKRTWNTMANIDLSSTAYWSDYQTNEQYFGMMSFDPGKEKSVCYTDGNKSEWNEKDIVQENQSMSISSKYDEKYIYFMVDLKGKNPTSETICIPIDTTHKSGSKEIKGYGIKTNRNTDFFIHLKGKNKSKLFVQNRYDNFDTMHLKYSYKNFNPYSKPPKKDDGYFGVVRTVLNELKYYDTNGEININDCYDENGINKDKKKYYILSEVDYTGNLLYGNGNPNSKDFNSLSDFCYGKDFIEIRIPWQMLNFYNPSKMEIHDDYYEKYGVEPLTIDKMYIGVGTTNSKIEMKSMELKGWGKKVTYHERLKESYYILKEYWQSQE